MFNNKFLCGLLLFAMLFCCVSSVNAISNDTMDNIVYDVDSNNEFISLSNDDKLENSVDESKSVLQIHDCNLSSNDFLKDDDGFEDDGFEDDDWDGDDEYELDDIEINEFLDDIKLSTSEEYYKFVIYLLDTKKFSFNQNSIVGGGYKIFTTGNYEMELYNGQTYKINNGGYYFVSTYSGLDLYVEGFYPNTFHYNENGDVIFDKLYYTWQYLQTVKYIDYDYIKETNITFNKYV